MDDAPAIPDAIGRAEYRLVMSKRLVDLGMEVAERAAEPYVDPGAYVAVSRAVRLTLLLNARFDCDLVALSEGRPLPDRRRGQPAESAEPDSALPAETAKAPSLGAVGEDALDGPDDLEPALRERIDREADETDPGWSLRTAVERVETLLLKLPDLGRPESGDRIRTMPAEHLAGVAIPRDAGSGLLRVPGQAEAPANALGDTS